jgi:two-component system, OmpR family, sensor histidine kinase ChvG
MRLAGQLLAVSAVTLLLPWAGCQYAREIESALRDGEEQALVSTARLLGAALAPAASAFPGDPARWSANRIRGADLYVHTLPVLPTLDGFVEDWGRAAEDIETVGGLALLAGRRGAFVYVFAVSPGAAPPAVLRVRGREAMLDFPLEAPGTVAAAIRGAPADPRARGNWQATSYGWQIEARVPSEVLGGRLGLSLLNADGSVRAASFTDAPGWMTGPDAAAQAALDALAPPGHRVYLLDRAGFVLAEHGPVEPIDPEAHAGVLDAVYRRMLGGHLETEPPPSGRPRQIGGALTELAALGGTDTRRYAVPGGGLLAVAAPVGGSGTPDVIIVVERATAEILSLTRTPTRRLLATSLLASLGAAVVLLGFAALLSFRIRRLRDAAGNAVGRRGDISGHLPGAAARDELGDLARSFGGLLGRVREHNLYLQSLGSRLAHELRTPLAVVRSSLDNLEAESATPGPWLGRARDGVDRMGGLVNALSAARQMERAVAAATMERFDLGAQVDEMVAAYRMLYPERTFACARPAQPCPLDGAPDLIAQLLDKLVENAVDFAAPGAPIRIDIEDGGSAWRLSVANSGSRLPPGTPGRLFDSLVSERPEGIAPHLGLGLFIVRLIAEHHRGQATASNLPGEDGVKFTVELPKAAAGEGCD